MAKGKYKLVYSKLDILRALKLPEHLDVHYVALTDNSIEITVNGDAAELGELIAE